MEDRVSTGGGLGDALSVRNVPGDDLDIPFLWNLRAGKVEHPDVMTFAEQAFHEASTDKPRCACHKTPPERPCLHLQSLDLTLA
ncbi:hypothetical protein GCM10007148_09310 [Parvularcula lutaonensis]|nr:hypothetical protein GCM10007148_09310 [Parvularcula lutaonensis]